MASSLFPPNIFYNIPVQTLPLSNPYFLICARNGGIYLSALLLALFHLCPPSIWVTPRLSITSITALFSYSAAPIFPLIHMALSRYKFFTAYIASCKTISINNPLFTHASALLIIWMLIYTRGLSFVLCRLFLSPAPFPLLT